jgi:Conjugative transposon protein TcpC
LAFVPFDLRRPSSRRGDTSLHARLDLAASRLARRRLCVAAGRAVLWTVLAFVALHGIRDILDEGGAPARAGASVSSGPVGWPDDEARAFAVRFARAYLTRSRRYPGSERQAVAAMTAPELRDALAVSVPRRARAQAVAQASVARVARLDANRALVTVACVVLGRSVSTRYLAVPVARDRSGALVVFDLPSFTSPPATAARASAVKAEPLEGADAGSVEALVQRFLTAYLAGQREQLPFFMVPGVAPPAPLGQTYRLLELERVEHLDRGRVAAVVRVRAGDSSPVYALRYRLRLAHRDRWLVQTVEG